MRIIAGPCQHESYEQSLEIAQICQEACNKYGFNYYFKASFDKANRSSIHGKRHSAPTVDESMAYFLNDVKKMREQIPNLKVLTDVHERWQIAPLEKVVNVIQIPAFLSRQTDLIRAVASSDRIEAVNIKKGQFMAPWDIEGVLTKVDDLSKVWITERGTSFGYNNLVVDFAGMEHCLRSYNVPFVYDVTHSVQKPSINGGSSGGDRSYVVPLLRAATALGVSNFFLEVHPDPDNAPSDGPNMLMLDDFDEALYNIAQYHYDPRNTG
jgi:2-dehydro-3-deoxyphosphooctonate aldolase (KDO 8-P synthase)